MQQPGPGTVESVINAQAVADEQRRLQTRQVLHTSVHLTHDEREVLQSALPHVDFRVSDNSYSTLHNVLQTKRIYDEQTVFELALRHGKRIVDIGGNAARHASRGRTIHCCNPTLDANDVVRAVSRQRWGTDGVSQCAHRIQDCTDGPFDSGIMVHSPYYFDAENMFTATLQTISRTIYAVAHPTPDSYGEIVGRGVEAWYRRCPNNVIEFYAQGANMCYRYTDPDWLYRSATRLSRGTLCVTPVFRDAITTVYCVTSTDRFFDTTARVAVKEFYSIGPDLFTNDSAISGHNVCVPASVLRVCAEFMAGRDRTADTLTQLRSTARRAMSKTRVPTEWYELSVAAAAAYTFDHHAGRVADIFGTLNQRLSKYSRLNAYLRLEGFQWHFEWLFGPIAAIVTLYCGSALYGLMRNPLRVIDSFLSDPAGTLSHAWATVCLLSCLWVSVWFSYHFVQFRRCRWDRALVALTRWAIRATRPRPRYLSGASIVERYLSGVGPFPTETAVYYIDSGVRLPSLDSVLTRAQLDALPTGPRSRFTIVEPIIDREHEAILTPAGIVSFHTLAPGVFGTSAHNVEAAIRIRTMPATGADRVSTVNLLRFVYRAWYLGHLDVVDGFYPNFDPTREVKFADWILKYPQHQRERLIRARLRVLNGADHDKWRLGRGFFLKMEMSLKFRHGRWTGEKPRIIQTATDEHNAILGPDVAAIQAEISRIWHVNARLPWVIAVNGTPLDFGERVREHLENYPDSVGSDDDDSNYDLYHEEFFLTTQAIACNILTRGARPHMYREMIEDIPTYAKYTRRGYVEIVNPGMMHSGNQQTLLFNSMTNCSKSTFQLACYQLRDRCLICSLIGQHPFCDACATIDGSLLRAGAFLHEVNSSSSAGARLVALRLPPPQQVMRAANGLMYVCGDDNAKWLSAASTPPADYTIDFQAKLGFTTEPRVNPVALHTRFCSARMWPTSMGYIMAGLPGRLIAKMGYYVQPANYLERTLRTMLRNDVRNRYQMLSWMPFVRVLLKRMIDLTVHDSIKTYKPAEWTADWLQDYTAASPNEDTWLMFSELYGLTENQEREYEALLASVERLPAIVNYAPLSRMFAVDCLEEDDEHDWDF